MGWFRIISSKWVLHLERKVWGGKIMDKKLTTIQIERSILEALDKFRVDERQSWNSIIKKYLISQGVEL